MAYVKKGLGYFTCIPLNRPASHGVQCSGAGSQCPVRLWWLVVAHWPQLCRAVGRGNVENLFVFSIDSVLASRDNHSNPTPCVCISKDSSDTIPLGWGRLSVILHVLTDRRRNQWCSLFLQRSEVCLHKKSLRWSEIESTMNQKNLTSNGRCRLCLLFQPSFSPKYAPSNSKHPPSNSEHPVVAT